MKRSKRKLTTSRKQLSSSWLAQVYIPPTSLLAQSSCPFPSSWSAPSSVTSCSGKQSVTFQVGVDFGSPCQNCEYRMYVKGYYKVNGVEQKHSLGNNTFLSKTTYQEDFCDPGRYGHKTGGCSGDSYQGCHFQTSDSPGIGDLQSGDTYEWKLEFKGSVIDNSSGMEVDYREWVIGPCSGTA